MPRVIFNNVKELVEWVKQMVKQGKKYYIFTTEENEIIFMPQTSTRPLVIGYLMTEQAKALAEKLVTSDKIGLFTHFHCKRFEWDTERRPYIERRKE